MKSRGILTLESSSASPPPRSDALTGVANDLQTVQPTPPKHVIAVAGLVTDRSRDRIVLIRSPRRGWEFRAGRLKRGRAWVWNGSFEFGPAAGSVEYIVHEERRV